MVIIFSGCSSKIPDVLNTAIPEKIEYHKMNPYECFHFDLTQHQVLQQKVYEIIKKNQAGWRYHTSIAESVPYVQIWGYEGTNQVYALGLERSGELITRDFRNFFSRKKSDPVSTKEIVELLEQLIEHEKHANQRLEQFTLSAEEALNQSVELLSNGQQIDAEKLIEKAVKHYPDDMQILFAKAVLERSRWGKLAAFLYMNQIILQFPNEYLSQASKLSLALDLVKSNENLNELVRLSDAYPDDIYLLWLSAIQCREQENGNIGRQQYEKLLEKFRVGPVLVHQTYANILTEYLDDYETALKHRYIAVSLEPKSWSYQGLANTLKAMGRYEDSADAWAVTVQLRPDYADYWSSWGHSLRRAGRYEEALGKHVRAYELDPGSAYDINFAGVCFQKLNRYEEMLEHYRRAAALNDAPAQYNLAQCYNFGRGVERDPSEAFAWYCKSARQGNYQAQFFVGLFYERGDGGVEQDHKKAAEWYQKAADQGDPKARHHLAVLLHGRCTGEYVTAGNTSEKCYCNDRPKPTAKTPVGSGNGQGAAAER